MKPAQITVTVGQEVALEDNGTGRYPARYTFNWTVTRVTPSGRFEVWNGQPAPTTGYDYTRRYFNNQGYELQDGFNGKIKNYPLRACTNVAELRARVAAKERIYAATALVNKIYATDNRIHEPAYQTKGSLLTHLSLLEEMLAAARAAVEAI